MALMFGFAEHWRSRAADFERSRLTYSWKKKLAEGAAVRSSSIVKEELLEI
jgi:hypothetical protein